MIIDLMDKGRIYNNILDFGCGPGIFMLELKKYGVFLGYGAVDRLRSKILGGFPTVREWEKRFLDRTKYSGKMTTIGGRNIPYKAEYPMFNTLIQGSCADYIKVCILRLTDKGFNIVNVIHDEIICYESTDRSNEMKDTMENCVSLSVPIKCDVKSVANWADK